MKIKVLFAAVFFGLFFSFTAVLYIRGRSNLESAKFKSVIEGISYGEKNIPDIIVKDKVYHLTPLRKEFKERVRVGDFIKKVSGKSLYKITKCQTGEVLYFKF